MEVFMRIVFFDCHMSHDEAEMVARDQAGRLPTLADPIFEGRGWYWLADPAGSKFYFYLANRETGEVLDKREPSLRFPFLAKRKTHPLSRLSKTNREK
jgi:hypothetical protein